MMEQRVRVQPMKTKEKIVYASLELFNDQGERNVTTNHIAAHLNISPGNLYYHFRNKADIIYEIFLQYENLVDTYLKLPENRDLTVSDMVFYLEAVFNGFWGYRFFHRDLEYLMDCDPRLRQGYRKFTLRCLDATSQIFHRLQASGVLMPMSKETVETMSLNVWLVVTNWMAFLKTAHAGEDNSAITLTMLKHGIYQVVTLEMPYITEPFREEVERICKKYRPDSFF